MVSHDSIRKTIRVPYAENVWKAWLGNQGIEINLSSAGRISKQMLRRLGGVEDTSTLAREGLIELLSEMEEGKPIKNGPFRGRVKRIIEREYLAGEPEDLIQRYISLGIIRAGIILQCEYCSRRSFYPIDELDYEVQCDKCRDPISIPSHSPKDASWAYQTQSPFSLPDRASGSYSVLATLRFLDREFLARTTPLMSSEFTAGEFHQEADLALLYEEIPDDPETRVVLLTECKTEKQFAREDIDSLKNLAQFFDEVILVFSFLRDSLEKEERLLFEKTAEELKGDPNTDLMLLGKRALLGGKPLQSRWEAGGVDKTILDSHDLHTLEGISEATRHIHLDV